MCEYDKLKRLKFAKYGQTLTTIYVNKSRINVTVFMPNSVIIVSQCTYYPLKINK